MTKYKEGIRGIKYKVVPAVWREGVSVRIYRNKKSPTNPMVLDLLRGKTIFAYADNRPFLSFGSLYAVAATNRKSLHLYQYDDVDDGVFKGYLIWMEDDAA